ncbi:MAG: hypothetical protein NTY76_07065 [Candidatus Omnitrophica bacterium]|nr:hypothetical protein [Candidatus Omnitrophota bacterium]
MRDTAILIMIVLSLLLPGPAMGGGIEHAGHDGDFTPEPTLISPTTEKVDLTGKTGLEFKWSSHEARRGFRKYYDFRLYKGYDMLEKSLLMKKEVDPNTYEFSVKSDTFSDGEVYTWSLRQVYDGMQKSRRSTASFKVIKK